MTEEYEHYQREQAARWLEHVRSLAQRVRVLQIEIEAQRDIGLKGIDYAERVSGSNAGDPVMDAVEKLQGLIASYCTELVSYLEEQQRAHEALLKIDDEACGTALRLYYLAGKSWEETCVEMGYSWDGMMTLRRRALVKAYEVMPPSERDPRYSAI